MADRRSILAAKQKQAETVKTAKMRVVAAWTLARTLAPNAQVHQHRLVANALLRLGTRALVGMTKNIAVIANNHKLAEKFEDIHKVSLNDFMDDENLVSKLKAEVEKELKAEPTKYAKGKKADEGAAPEGAPTPLAADAEPPVMGGEPCSIEVKAEINKLEDDIASIQTDIDETTQAELDLELVFDEGAEADKKANLAHEAAPGDDNMFDDEHMGSEDELNHLMDMTASEILLSEDTDEVDGIQAFLEGDNLKSTNEAIKKNEEAADEFESSFTASGEYDEVAADDHDGDLLAEIAMELGQPELPNQDRQTEPMFEEAETPLPKMAGRKGKPVRSLGDTAVSKMAANDPTVDLVEKALFGE